MCFIAICVRLIFDGKYERWGVKGNNERREEEEEDGEEREEGIVGYPQCLAADRKRVGRGRRLERKKLGPVVTDNMKEKKRN